MQENIIFVSKPISNHNLKNRIQTLPADCVTEQVRTIVSVFRFLPFGVRVCDITIHRRSVSNALGTELSRRVVLSLTTGRNQNGADSSLADFISHARQQVASSDDVNRVSLLGYTIASYQAWPQTNGFTVYTFRQALSYTAGDQTCTVGWPSGTDTRLSFHSVYNDYTQRRHLAFVYDTEPGMLEFEIVKCIIQVLFYLKDINTLCTFQLVICWIIKNIG